VVDQGLAPFALDLGRFRDEFDRTVASVESAPTPSATSSTLSRERRAQALDEQYFEAIDVAMLYIEQARARAERAADELRKSGADEHLVEALEKAEREISDVARRLRQGTLFAVPKEQLTL
jgi:hypothetical protein